MGPNRITSVRMNNRACQADGPPSPVWETGTGVAVTGLSMMVDGVFVDVGAGRLVSVGVFAVFSILVRVGVVRSGSFGAWVGFTVRVEVGFGRVVFAGFGFEGVRVGVLVCVGTRVEKRVGM